MRYQVANTKLKLGHYKSIILFLTMLFLFLGNNVFAGTPIYTEHFNNTENSYYLGLGWHWDYVSGNYVGKCFVGAYFGCYYIGGLNSSLINYNYAIQGHSGYVNTNNSANYVEFNFVSADVINSNQFFDIYIYGKKDTNEATILRLEGQENNLLVYQNTAPIWYQLGTFNSLPTFNYLRIELDKDANKFRIKFNDNDFTIWSNVIGSFDFDYFSKIQIYNANNTFWIDDFIVGNIAEPFSSCGGGLYLQFCYNAEDCAVAGGYWRNNFCYEESENVSDFESYYAEHSNFDTPTIFLSSLVSVSTPVIDTIGNFLTTFEKNFVIASATEKGYLFGSAIPQARGYLDIINDFFGGLPIGELLMFFIVVILLVAVVRLVSKLINIIKP